jgi:signal transduction histidine kinase
VTPPTGKAPPAAIAARPLPLPEPEAAQPITAPARGLFGLAPAPFVVGDFVAAVRLPQGGWATVQPVPEPFPNAWQRRVLLWFVVAALIVVPAGWWFSRRLVGPIASFARAAERLGRDPRAPVLELSGPAEVGRAAHAFNRMQSQLRSFVEDRTAMMGAISHDMRTPLTRMRFRIEDVPEELQAGMLDDVDEMEQMISSVLAFIRDASEPGPREQLNLSSIVEDVVENAVFVGKDVRLEHSEEAAVDVDAIGMRRVLDNLVENAVKYGNEARVRLFIDRQEAVAEVADSGPGLPEDELDRVFQPFYRAAAARVSGKKGVGLGLAVCRSIARAHGGDVQLRRGARGLVAQLRVPLVVDFATAR